MAFAGKRVVGRGRTDLLYRLISTFHYRYLIVLWIGMIEARIDRRCSALRFVGDAIFHRIFRRHKNKVTSSVQTLQTYI